MALMTVQETFIQKPQARFKQSRYTALEWI